MMYVLKIKGQAKIPDYVQVRAADFTLIAYFRLDRPEKALQKMGLANKEHEIIEELKSIPYGRITRVNWSINETS